ncbi:hypothetical protein [Burkholderia pyrrocinia]|uniref:hypothetical protein n=1 Tax=Burkholderia pyrrocinia TaxID=60550 RepID=UPI0012601659|nr:hypothetical protein [Burkholderia pyrrocinia]
MFSKKNPEFRRPTVGPRRSAWPYRFSELFFGALAKATMVFALLAVIALEVLSGGAGASASDLPSTRKGWRNLFLVIFLIFVVVAVGIYLFSPEA